jgi:hypothetical protein
MNSRTSDDSPLGRRAQDKDPESAPVSAAISNSINSPSVSPNEQLSEYIWTACGQRMVRVHGFWVEKGGNLPHENEDAWACGPDFGVVALSDGATEYFEAKLWARALVTEYARNPPAAGDGSNLEWLEPPARAWKESFDLSSRPYYIETKASLGSFATFLGVRISDTEPLRWDAMGLGDTCLFHVRGGRLLSVFPLSDSTQFNNSPILVSTQRVYNQRAAAHWAAAHGEFGVGDYLLLATDALAAWCLRQSEQGQNPWDCLVAMTAGAFSPWISNLRENRAIRNDDVTLVRISIFSEPDQPLS